MVKPYARDELEWVDLPSMNRGKLDGVVDELVKMTPALKANAGKWAVLDHYDDKKRAASIALQLRKRYPAFEFASRAVLEGGSTAYVRFPAVPR